MVVLGKGTLGILGGSALNHKDSLGVGRDLKTKGGEPGVPWGHRPSVMRACGEL